MNDFDYLELDIHITPEQRALKAQVHAFARDVLRPAASALDQLADPAAVIAADSPLWPACPSPGPRKAAMPP